MLKSNTGESIYLRVYPWVDNDPAVRTGKYLAIQNVLISGTAIGVTADPPTVTQQLLLLFQQHLLQAAVIYLLTAELSVTARGVVWNTIGTPTTSK